MFLDGNGRLLDVVCLRVRAERHYRAHLLTGSRERRQQGDGRQDEGMTT